MLLLLLAPLLLLLLLLAPLLLLLLLCSPVVGRLPLRWRADLLTQLPAVALSQAVRVHAQHLRTTCTCVSYGHRCCKGVPVRSFLLGWWLTLWPGDNHHSRSGGGSSTAGRWGSGGGSSAAAAPW
jgi:hypothetical protein